MFKSRPYTPVNCFRTFVYKELSSDSQNGDLERADCDEKDQVARHINASETKSEDGQFIFALNFLSISAQISSQLARWLGEKAEELGVEIHPGFAATEILYDDEKVIGIATNDMGIAKDGSRRDNFQCGVELKGRITLLGEGCRGSLSEKIMKKYNLMEKVQGQHQTYALGIKEVWEIDSSKHEPGHVPHTLGWPLDNKTNGGSFLYHMKDRQVSLGLVVALNYHNPFLNPYEEFQLWEMRSQIVIGKLSYPLNYNRVGIENFIRAKYKEKRWVPKDGKPMSPCRVIEEKASMQWQRPSDRSGHGYTNNSHFNIERGWDHNFNIYTMGQNASISSAAPAGTSRTMPSASPIPYAAPPTQSAKEYDFSSLTQGFFSKS